MTPQPYAEVIEPREHRPCAACVACLVVLLIVGCFALAGGLVVFAEFVRAWLKVG